MSNLLKVIRREEKNIAQLIPLLDDPRGRLLATRLMVLKHQTHIISYLLDPPVVGNVKQAFTERQVATLNKQHLTKIHSEFSSAASILAVSLTNLMDTAFDVDPVVESETDLSTNLGKVYRTVMESIEKINLALSEIESTAFPDEVLKATAIMRKHWGDLHLLLTNQIIEPLKAALIEMARDGALKEVSNFLYGEKQIG
jgi:hypothetical protein